MVAALDLNAISPGVTENEAAAAAYSAMRNAELGFPDGRPIFAWGCRAGVAHLTFADGVLEPGDTVILEIGRRGDPMALEPKTVFRVPIAPKR